jgi:DNA-binding transcriptional MerR regulator
MAYKEKEIEKLYYSIGEVAQMLDVNTSLLRYWESEFKELQVRKDRNGVRLFTKQDIEKIKTIYSLVKEKGFTIEGAKLQLKQSIDISDNEKALERLLTLKAKMQQILAKLST